MGQVIKFRYLEITEIHKGGNFTLCEYPGDLGMFTYKYSAHRFQITMGASDTWLVCSNLPITKEMANHACMIWTSQPTRHQPIDLSLVSNPINKRKPTMNSKGKK